MKPNVMDTHYFCVTQWQPRERGRFSSTLPPSSQRRSNRDYDQTTPGWAETLKKLAAQGVPVVIALGAYRPSEKVVQISQNESRAL